MVVGRVSMSGVKGNDGAIAVLSKDDGGLQVGFKKCRFLLGGNWKKGAGGKGLDRGLFGMFFDAYG